MTLLEILLGTSILLFIVLVVLVLVLVFRAQPLPSPRRSPRSELEKIKAQIGE